MIIFLIVPIKGRGTGSFLKHCLLEMLETT